MTANVLVLGSDTRAFLATVRSLGRAGHRVIGGGEPGPARFSRYLVAWRRVPGGPAFRGVVQKLIDEFSIDLVIPCDDASTWALHLDRRSYATALALPGPTQLESVFYKRRSLEIASEAGLSVPPWRDAGDAWPPTGPYVVKPVASLPVPGGRLGVSVHDELASAKRGAADLAQYGPVTIQDHVPGHGIGVELLVHEGEALAAFQHERIHEPPRGGGSSLRRSIPLDGAFEDAQRLVRALGWSGVCMVEFRRGDKDWFMEVNGRLWGSLPLAIKCGMDFPRFLVEYLLEGTHEFPRDYKVGRRQRNLRLDLAWQSANRATKGVPRRQVARQWLGALSTRESWDTWARDDPRPALAEFREMAQTGARMLGWRQRRPAVNRIRAVRSDDLVLFVCKGNICRSPFAEHYARKRGLRAISAGTYPMAGRPTPAEGIDAAQGWGVDLAGHKSAVLDDHMVDDADHIFVFDHENHDRVLEGHPQAASKIAYLGAAAGEPVIPDPWMGDLERFRQCYDQIAGSVDALTGTLDRP